LFLFECPRGEKRKGREKGRRRNGERTEEFLLPPRSEIDGK